MSEEGKKKKGCLPWIVGLLVLGWLVQAFEDGPAPQATQPKDADSAKSNERSTSSTSDLARRRADTGEEPSPPKARPTPADTGSDDNVAEALSILAQTERLIAEGRAMERLRQTSDPGLLAQCGEKMRKYQPAARVLADDAMELPLEIRGDVTAPAETVMCVSCSRNAGQSCRVAEAALDAGRRGLRR